MIEICTVSGGNDHEHPFSLSIFAAWMLVEGIWDYVHATIGMHETKFEDSDYCLLRIETAQKVCRQLRDWAVAVDPNYLVGTIEDLDGLLAKLESEKERLEPLAIAEEEEYMRKRDLENSRPASKDPKE